MRTQRIRAVGLILVNTRGEILILRERNLKPHLHKFDGMRSIPLETVRSTETLEHAVHRLVQEELPGLSVPEFEFQGMYWTPCPTPNVWSWIYTAQTDSFELPAVGDEVDQHSWVEPRRILGLWLRPTVYEMVDDYRRGVRNKHPHRSYRRVAHSEEEHDSLLTRR